MPADQTPQQAARNFFTDGLRNAHAMEKQALSIMQPQLNRLEHYPEVAAMLDRHIRETEGQIQRLDQLLEGLGDAASGFKDVTQSLVGTMAAMGHTVAPDEIIKNSLANFAFENFEIAAYTSLITAAESCGAIDAIPLLRQTLDEELHMAAAVHDSLPEITRKFIMLSASDQRADI